MTAQRTVAEKILDQYDMGLREELSLRKDIQQALIEERDRAFEEAAIKAEDVTCWRTHPHLIRSLKSTEKKEEAR